MLNLPILFVFLVALTLGGLYISELLKKNKKEQQLYGEAQAKSDELIHEAIKKSQSILSVAEVEGIKAATDLKIQTAQIEKKLEEQLLSQTDLSNKTLNQELVVLRNQLSAAQSEYQNYLNDLKSKGVQIEDDISKLIKQQTVSLFERFEAKLAEFLTQTEQQSIITIDTELRATRELINSYKEQQMRLIDENIVAILERTLSLVLIKKLSLKDQIDLVYESLEKAKQEKFIV